MITLADVNTVNWNLLIPIAVSACGSLLVLLAVWDRIRKCFAEKRVEKETDELKSRVHLLEVWRLTTEKREDKLDQILEAIFKKKIGND